MDGSDAAHHPLYVVFLATFREKFCFQIPGVAGAKFDGASWNEEIVVADLDRPIFRHVKKIFDSVRGEIAEIGFIEYNCAPLQIFLGEKGLTGERGSGIGPEASRRFFRVGVNFPGEKTNFFCRLLGSLTLPVTYLRIF